MKNKQIMAVLAFGMIGLLGTGFVMAYQGDMSVQGPDYSDERHIAMTEAFENLDYAAWSTLMADRGNSRVTQVITEENFVTFVEMHNAMVSGDSETAQELRAELGLGQGKMSGNNGEGRGSGSGQKGQGRMSGNNGECPYSN